MGTTTAEKKDREHVFYAAGVNFRVVRRPQLEEVVAGVGTRVVQKELVHDFSPTNGFFRVRPGEHLLPTGPDGEEEDAIDYLRRSPAFNVHFWEEGNEPDRMLPTERDFLEDLIGATSRSDVEAITALRVQEARTHRRTMLLEATATALDQLGALVPSLEEIEQSAANERAAAAGLPTG